MNKRFQIMMAVVITVLGMTLLLNGCSYSSSDSDYTPPVTRVAYPDIDQYFAENSEVQQIVPVQESSDVMTEQEVYEMLKSRGFSDGSITTEYTITGDYHEPKEISADGTAKHPIYSTSYAAATGEIWNITVVNGQVMARPISYLNTVEQEQSVLFVEGETTTSYDSQGNRFFITIPHADYMIVKSVDQIDAQTLDSLIEEEIAK